MAGKDKYVAYVSSYTSGLGTKYGIRIYDVDLNKGRLTEKQKVEININENLSDEDKAVNESRSENNSFEEESLAKK